MIIERNDKEVIIRISASINTDDLQDFIDYTRYKELTAKNSVTQEEIDKLSNDINKEWWTSNRRKFVK